MAMYLAGEKVETIQMIGRWKSRSFMRYLRIQVPETTRGVATRMTSRHTFFTIDHGPRTNDENKLAETRSTPSGVANHYPTLTTMSSETLRGEGERITRTRFQGQTAYRYRLRKFEHCDDHSTATVHSTLTTTRTTPSNKRT
jgi:hypothetical protein